jgi:hypothetical protein
MQWDGSGIEICQSHSVRREMDLTLISCLSGIFNRDAVPEDVYRRRPEPTSWRTPDAAFASCGCDPDSVYWGVRWSGSHLKPSPPEYFFNMQIIFGKYLLESQ